MSTEQHTALCSENQPSRDSPGSRTAPGMGAALGQAATGCSKAATFLRPWQLTTP